MAKAIQEKKKGIRENLLTQKTNLLCETGLIKTV